MHIPYTVVYLYLIRRKATLQLRLTPSFAGEIRAIQQHGTTQDARMRNQCTRTSSRDYDDSYSEESIPQDDNLQCTF